MNPRRIAGLLLVLSDVVLAPAVWGVAIVIRSAWGTTTIAGVLPTNAIAGVLPVALWVVLRAAVGLYPGYGLGAAEELRRQSYATLGALLIASAYLGLHQGQDVSRSVLIGGFLALLIGGPLVRRSVKRGLEKARLWGRQEDHG